MRTARPHLLAVDEPATVDPGAPRLDPRGVAAGVGLAEELAPDDVLAQRRHHPARHLVLGRVLNQGEDHPAGDAVLRTGHPGGAELLFNHELLHRARGPSPRGGPVRHDVAGLDHGVALCRGIEPLHPLREGAHLVADRFGLGRQVDGAHPPCAAAHQIGDVAGGRLAVHERLECGRPAQVEVRIVLPGEADAPVHLDVELRALVRRRQGERRRHGRRQRELVAAVGGRPGGVPDERRRELRRHEHVGAVVLDGLERRDGPSELHPHLGVGGGLLRALGRDAHGLGGGDQAGQVDQDAPPAGDHLGRRTRQRDARAAPCRVEVVRNVHHHAARSDVDHDDVVPRGEDEQMGEATAQDRRSRAGGLAVRHRDVRRQRDRAEDRAVGQSGQQARRAAHRARQRRSPRWRSPSARRVPASRRGRAPRSPPRARAGRSRSRPCPRAGGGRASRATPGHPRMGAVTPSPPRAGPGRPLGHRVWRGSPRRSGPGRGGLR